MENSLKMSKKRGIKCSWCLDESPIVYRTLWYNRRDRVTKKTENFGEMLVECYDLDPDQWSKSKMIDAVICYVCICSLRIACNEKQETLAAAYYKSIKNTSKHQKQRSKESRDSINGDSDSKVYLEPRKSEGQTSEPQKPLKSTAPDKVDLESKIDSSESSSSSSFWRGPSQGFRQHQALKDVSGLLVGLQKKVNLKPIKSKALTTTSKPQKPIKSTAPVKIDSRPRESKVNLKPIKSKALTTTSKPQKPIKSTAPDKVDLESKIGSRLRKSRVPTSKPQKPIKSKAVVKVDLESRRKRSDPRPQKSKSSVDINLEEEYLEVSEEEYLEGMEVEESKSGTETFLEEEYLEDIQPKEIIIPGNPIPTISFSVEEVLQEEYLEPIKPYEKEIHLVNDSEMTKEDFIQEYLDETKPDIDKMDLDYQYEFLDNLPDDSDSNNTDIGESETADLNTKPNNNVNNETARNNTPQVKKSLKTEDLLTVLRYSKRKNMLPERKPKDMIVRKSNRKVKLTTAAMEYKKKLKSKRHFEVVIFKSEGIKTDKSKENCGDFDKVYLEDTNEEMYVSENWKLQNYVIGRSPGRGGTRARPKVMIRNRALFNELIHKLNNKQLKLKEAAEKMGLTLSRMRRLAAKHPKYIPRKNKAVPTPAKLNEIVEKLNKNQLSLNGAAVKMDVSYYKLKSLVTKHPKYNPSRKPPKPIPKSKESISHTISRIKAEFPEDELRTMMTAIRQKKLMMKVARKKLRCSPRVLQEILLEMCGSTGRGENVTPDNLLNDIQSILTYTNTTPFRLGSGWSLTCAYCYCLHGKDKAEVINTPDELRDHTRIKHNAVRVVAVKHFTKLGQEILRVDITNLQCTVCPTRLPSWHEMFSHLETIHSVRLEAAKSGVIPYVLDSQTKTNFTCAICPKQFLGISKLNQHMNSHATGNKCFICNKTFMYNDLLRIHERRIHNNPERNDQENNTFCCDQCGKVMRSETGLRIHKRVMHEGKSIEQPKLCCCEYCGKAYSTNYQCAYHIHHVHGVPKPFRYRCKVCLDKFPSKLKRVEHMLKVHNMQVTYTCDWCPKTFPIRNYLMKHLNKAHNQKTSLTHPTEL